MNRNQRPNTPAPVRVPQPGQILRIDAEASVQFGGSRALTLRVTKICERSTYQGWVWITGYVLDPAGNAIEKREIFVQLAGLKPAPPPGGDNRTTRAPARIVRPSAYRDLR